MVSVVKMATVTEGVLLKSSLLLSVFFLWTKGLNIKDTHKEMFPIYDGKCLPRKAVHNWVEKFTQGLSKDADGAGPGAEVVETTVQRLLGCGFRRTGKAMGGYIEK
jgi:hypothetical protein